MLEHIKSKRKRRKFLVWDLEWYPGTYQLRLCGVHDGAHYRYYTTIEKFLEAELIPKNNNAWFFAHAGGLADMAFVFEAIAKIPGVVVDARFSGSSAIIVSLQWKGGEFWFIDSYWLLRDKLRKIGEALGMLKGGEENSIKMFSAPLPELATYNEQDCLILWTAISQFEDLIWDLGSQMQMTIASCAMGLFRRVHLTEKIETSATINDWASEAYIASRVEPIKPFCVDADYFDINSSFPYAMTFPAPGNVKKFRPGLPDHELYIADAEISVPECHLPPLARREGNRIYFPTGSWRAWFTGVDLQLLLKRGGKIKRVFSCVEFHPNNDLETYSRTIYKLRKEAKTPYMKLVLKYLLNSCYGKFAEGNEKEKLLIRPASTRCTHKVRCPEDSCMRMLFPGAWLMKEQVEIAHQHVPFAAHITAIARRTLEGFLQEAGDPYYCDTDSIVTHHQFGTSYELGALKHEKHVSEARFAAAKVYQIDDEVKAKGFPRLNAEGFDRIMHGWELSEPRMLRIREMFTSHDLTPRESLKSKSMRFIEREKRCIDYARNCSRPWTVEETKTPYEPASWTVDHYPSRASLLDGRPAAK